MLFCQMKLCSIKWNMKPPSIALVTIGQTPRDDLAAPILAELPAGVRARQYGLLDGLSPKEAAERFAPRGHGIPLVTLLAGGREILIDAHAAGDALQELIGRLEDSGVDTMVTLCTGTFEDVRPGRVNLVQPDKVIPGEVARVAGGRRVGVLVPSPRQLEWPELKWAALAQEPVYAAASPYGDRGGVSAAARSLVERGAEVLVLDCMGYGAGHREAAAAATGVTVLASSEILARSLRLGGTWLPMTAGQTGAALSSQ